MWRASASGGKFAAKSGCAPLVWILIGGGTVSLPPHTNAQ